MKYYWATITYRYKNSVDWHFNTFLLKDVNPIDYVFIYNQNNNSSNLNDNYSLINFGEITEEQFLKLKKLT